MNKNEKMSNLELFSIVIDQVNGLWLIKTWAILREALNTVRHCYVSMTLVDGPPSTIENNPD